MVFLLKGYPIYMKDLIKIIGILGLVGSLAACGGSAGEVVEGPADLVPTPLFAPLPEDPQDRYPGPGVLFQWAVSAEASSEFSSPEWGADQVLGEPNSPGCGDYQFAWASAASDSRDTLVLEYASPVFPLEIVIFESFNPDQVAKVELFDSERGGFYTVLQKNPLQISRPCPYELIVPVEGISFKTNQIRITLDQSQLGLGWNEIDAVELIGTLSQP